MKMTKPTKMAIAPTVVPVSILFQISRQGIVGVIMDGSARASDVDTDAVTKMVVVVDGTPADGSPETETDGAVATERSGADVKPIPNPKRAPSEDDALVLPPRTGERRPPAAPVNPPRRLLPADGASVYRYLGHILELR
jgi:hypothetical protein